MTFFLKNKLDQVNLAMSVCWQYFLRWCGICSILFAVLRYSEPPMSPSTKIVSFNAINWKQKKPKTNRNPFSKFHTKTKNENKIWVSFSYTIENRLALRYTDWRTQSEFEFRFLPGGEKKEKRKWQSNFVFLLQRKTKNENIQYNTFYTIENRLALRYTDCLALGFSYASSSLTINNCQADLRSASASFA